MSVMLEARGNLWSLPADLRCITTNGFVKANGTLVMGRGCALEAATKYPTLPKLLGDTVRARGNHVAFVALPKEPLATFPVKHNWWEKADPSLIVRSAHELVDLANRHEWMKRILVPRPGCGNGGLSWQDVKPLLEPVLDGRFTIVSH